jgi:gamma-glutamyltranspeptidase / glutathione hydrolase
MKETHMGWKAVSRTGVVAAGGEEAIAAGIRILEHGGNAADAAAGTIFALNVTDHGDCSIGGEVPLLIYDAKRGEVKSLCGQGRAPLSQDAIDWYMANGIPGGGDIKMAPVPSVVDLCLTTLSVYGTRSFEQIIAPTLELLDSGSEEWHPKLAHTLRRMVAEEHLTSGDRKEKLKGVCDRFYGRHSERNDIAEELEAYYIERGGFLRRADLAAHRTTIEDPVSVDYRGLTVCKCGTWTQGPYLCQALKLLEGFDLAGMDRQSVDYIHIVIEAIKLAMADRDTYYGDPDFVEVPLDVLLSEAYADLRRPLIDPDLASTVARPGNPYTMEATREGGEFRPGPGGTTTCVVADRYGNVVSATPSANVPVDVRDGGIAGVTFGNRLRSLNTTPGHPNCIAPGKRPRITLTPTLVLKNQKPIIAISVAGGDLQDQVALKLLLDNIEFDMSPEQAVTSSRFATAHHEDSFDPNPRRDLAFLKAGSLQINTRTPAETIDGLSKRGHIIDEKTGPIGHPVMLFIDQTDKTYYAAGDPEAKRHASGLSD